MTNYYMRCLERQGKVMQHSVYLSVAVVGVVAVDEGACKYDVLCRIHMGSYNTREN